MKRSFLPTLGHIVTRARPIWVPLAPKVVLETLWVRETRPAVVTLTRVSRLRPLSNFSKIIRFYKLKVDKPLSPITSKVLYQHCQPGSSRTLMYLASQWSNQDRAWVHI